MNESTPDDLCEMNEPAPREICQKLMRLGCGGDMRSFWVKKDGELIVWVSPVPLNFFNLPEEHRLSNVQVFFQNDFTGATEQADDNLKILFGNDSHISFNDSFYGRICKICRAYLDGEDARAGYEDDRGACWEFMKRQLIQTHRISYRREKAEIWWQYLERTMKR